MENTDKMNIEEQPTVSQNTGFMQNITNNSNNFSTWTWVGIVFVAIFLIFNFITYFSSGIQNITLDMDSGLKKILGIFTLFFGKTIAGTAGVAKDVIGGTADVLDTGLTVIQDEVSPNDTSTSLSSQNIQQSSPSNKQPTQQNALNNTLKSSSSQSQSQPFPASTSSSRSQSPSPSGYEASSAQSTINSTGKNAWCYVGQDRGFRSCAQVGTNEQCMSGDIFPTNELCINPNLRN